MSYPPLNHPMVGRDGLITVPWRNYFQTLSAGIVPGATAINQLTGDVTAGPGVGSQVATIAALAVTTGKIANDAVTYAKIQNVAANSYLGRVDAASGDVGEVTLAASQLAGRGSSGNIAAVTLGTNLSMSGTTLNATAIPAGDVTSVFLLMGA